MTKQVAGLCHGHHSPKDASPLRLSKSCKNKFPLLLHSSSCCTRHRLTDLYGNCVLVACHSLLSISPGMVVPKVLEWQVQQQWNGPSMLLHWVPLHHPDEQKGGCGSHMLPRSVRPLSLAGLGGLSGVCILIAKTAIMHLFFLRKPSASATVHRDRLPARFQGFNASTSLHPPAEVHCYFV